MRVQTSPTRVLPEYPPPTITSGTLPPDNAALNCARAALRRATRTVNDASVQVDQLRQLIRQLEAAARPQQ